MLQVFAVLLSFLFCYIIHINWSLKGPFILPFIGSPEVIYYLSHLTIHEFYDKILLRTYGKVVCVNFMGITEFHIIDASEALRILRDLKRTAFLHDASIGIMDNAAEKKISGAEAWLYSSIMVTGIKANNQ